jgi:hypothetical protein
MAGKLTKEVYLHIIIILWKKFYTIHIFIKKSF